MIAAPAFFKHFRQAIKEGARVQVMDVVIADVRGEPGHDWTRAHVAGGFHCGLFISPAQLVAKRNIREIMLGIEQIRPNREANKTRDSLRQQQRRTSAKIEQCRCHSQMHNQSNQAVKMFARVIKKWVEAHSPDKHERITEQNGERMANKKVESPFIRRGFYKLFLRHDGERADR